MKKQSRLQFTEEKRADPTLVKSRAKSEKAADKLEKAQANIPKKTVKNKERTFDADTSKAKVCLHFEEVDKPKPPSKLEHGIEKAPQKLLLLLCIRKSANMNRIMWGLKQHTTRKRQANLPSTVSETGRQVQCLTDFRSLRQAIFQFNSSLYPM